MKVTAILSLFKPVKKLVDKVLALTLDNRFLGYINANSDPLCTLFVRSKMATPCAPQYSDIKQ